MARLSHGSKWNGPALSAPWAEEGGTGTAPWQTGQAAIWTQPLDGAVPFGAETALANASRVNTFTSGQQYDAAIATLTGGGYVVIWDDNGRGDVFGQRYDSAGNALGGEFQVNITTTADTQLFPTVAGLANGGFVAAWQSGTLGSADIRAQVFDASGSAVGAEILVNTNTADEQLNAKVTGLDGGGFVVTWDTITGGAYQEVSGQIYTAAGTPVGGQFVVNTTTADQQGISTIAALPGGGFVAIWQSITPRARTMRRFSASASAPAAPSSAGSSRSTRRRPTANSGTTWRGLRMAASWSAGRTPAPVTSSRGFSMRAATRPPASSSSMRPRSRPSEARPSLHCRAAASW